MARIVTTQLLRQPALALVLATGLTHPVVAQSPSTTGAANIMMRSRWLQEVEQRATHEALHKGSNRDKEIAQERTQFFNARLADFTKSWNKLMKLADNGVWNAKEAKKTRQAFERLVKTEGWIEESKGSDGKTAARHQVLPEADLADSHRR